MIYNELDQNLRSEHLNDNINNILDDYLNSSDEKMYMESYVGLVVKNNGGGKNGKVQIRVQGIHSDEIPDADLPWAIQDNSGTSSKFGTLTIPELKSYVNVRFHNGDIYQPKYYSTVITKDQTPKAGAAGYPDNLIWFQSKKGTVVSFKRDTEEFSIKHATGTYIKIDRTGAVEIDSVISTKVMAPIVSLGPDITIDTAAGVVTQLCACAMGIPHPMASVTVKATL